MIDDQLHSKLHTVPTKKIILSSAKKQPVTAVAYAIQRYVWHRNYTVYLYIPLHLLQPWQARFLCRVSAHRHPAFARQVNKDIPLSIGTLHMPRNERCTQQTVQHHFPPLLFRSDRNPFKAFAQTCACFRFPVSCTELFNRHWCCGSVRILIIWLDPDSRWTFR